MQNRHLFNKVITGSTAVLLALTLAACGHHDAVTTSSSSSSVRSAKTTSNNGSKAYRSANKLIRNNNYEAAYDRLNSVDNRSTQENNLATDLQNYMNARTSYKSGDYATAAATLKEQKSTSPAMRDAYSDLQDKISKAQSSSASSSSSQAISKSSSSKSNSNSSSQTTSDQTNDDVVVEFANKMGFSGDKGYQIIQTDKSGNTYKFEVRRSNSDNTVANLVGIYQYNTQSGAVTKLS
ncbi:hypothetical protein [Limosilactobacillus sp.]|uniref:hypothetical protein n=1 Tax=Limosilactobacillus sp. TaxID=2773925 RepID=UPI003F054264